MHGHDDGRDAGCLFAENLPQDIAHIDNLVNGSGRRRDRDDGGGECGRGNDRGNDRECGCDPV